MYRSGAVHVDVARLYQQDIVPMRIFDIVACGGFVIAEHSEDLERLFDVGRDLESWKTPDELQEKIAHYLSHPDEARVIAQQGLQTIRRSHSIRARVQAILNVAAEHRTGRTAV